MPGRCSAVTYHQRRLGHKHTPHACASHHRAVSTTNIKHWSSLISVAMLRQICILMEKPSQTHQGPTLRHRSAIDVCALFGTWLFDWKCNAYGQSVSLRQHVIRRSIPPLHTTVFFWLYYLSGPQSQTFADSGMLSCCCHVREMQNYNKSVAFHVKTCLKHDSVWFPQ